MMPKAMFYAVQEDYNYTFINFEYSGFEQDLKPECLITDYNRAKTVYDYDPKHRRILQVSVTCEMLNTESESNWGG